MAGGDTAGILFVDIGADLEALGVADDHERVLRAGGCVLAGADVDLQDRAVARRLHGEAIDEQLVACEIAFGGVEFGAGGLQFCAGDIDIDAAVLKVFEAYRARIGDRFEACELRAGFGELGFGDRDIGGGDADAGFCRECFRLQVAVVETEERLAGFHFIVYLHIDLRDDACFGCADGDIFAECLEDAGGRYRVRKRFCGWLHVGRGGGGRHLLLRLQSGDHQDGDDAPDGGGDRSDAEDVGKDSHDAMG